jgi:RimJ/RimL family protein N-acetyltransferase
MNVLIAPIAESDLVSFRECLDLVARERKFLALIEAPPLEHMRGFVSENIAKNLPQVVAREGDRVVGWCDILPGWHHALRHCGSVGMGLLPQYRGRGLGQRLLEACLTRAKDVGISRIELEARADNEHALRLYRRMGFEFEGTKRRGMKVDGHYVDTIAMALLLDAGA